VRVEWSETIVTWNSLVNGVQADGIEAAVAPIIALGANNGSENIGTGQLLLDVTASLQSVQSGTLPGYGWVMMPYPAGSNGIDFYTREFADVALRPKLTVEVVPVPEPGAYALMMAGLGVVAWAARRSRRQSERG
jgi:hypothetical protein